MDDPTHCRPVPAPAPGEDAVAAVYLEVAPLQRHRPFVDHIYILCDDGVLTAAERSLFASPFREINFTLAQGQAAGGWRQADRPPRFGSARRRQAFHGWILGIRCLPFAPLKPVERHQAVPAALSEALVRNLGDGAPLDRLVCALDACVDRLIDGQDLLPAAGAPAAPGLDWRPDVRSTAEAAGVSARTLQRHMRAGTGLAPKRWLALLRFAKAARHLALAPASLAEIAAETGYADQAHLTAEFGRHAATSPGRLRTQARRQLRRDAVRFIKDPALRSRIRLLLVEQ